MNKKQTNETKIIVLGGLGEVGKNMYCVMHKDDIVIIDAGISFPENYLLGVDYVLPDFTFLKENENKIRALLITHGHEDHIGAIPFLLSQVNIPAIYAPNQAKELISVKLQDNQVVVNDRFRPTLIPQLETLGILKERIGSCIVKNVFYPIYNIDYSKVNENCYYLQDLVAA